MSDVTEGDRVKAVGLLCDAAVDKLIQSTEYRHQARMVERIATLVASERAAAVAEAWDEAASELELSGHSATHWAVVGFRRRADQLRAAVTDTTGDPA